MNKHGFFHRIFGSCHKSKGQWLIQRISKKLSLDTKQQARLAELGQQIHHSEHDIQSVRRESRHEVMQLLTEPQPDRDKAKSVLQNKLATIIAQTSEMVDTFGDFIDTLNPQQRQQLHAYIQKHDSRHGCRC